MNNNDFTKQAARASWILPFLLLGMMAIGNSTLKSANSPLGVIIFGGVIICLFLTGIVLGVIGIFGVKKHGASATVVSGILGIIINGVFLTLLLLIAFSAFQKTRAGTNTSTWLEFRSQEGKFSICMPVTPSQRRQTVNTPNGDIQVFSFVVENNITYLVTYSDYPQGYVEQFDATSLLNNVRDGALANGKGKLVSEQSISYQTYPGKEITVLSKDGMIVRSRTYVVGSRLYQILVGGTQENLNSAPTAKFFDSFKFLP